MAGEIHAENLEPHGARVTVELPVETPVFAGDTTLAGR